jgi:transposase
MDLTDEQWSVLDPLMPRPRMRVDGRGRPWKDSRAVLNGILWVLRTDAPWHDLPNRYPSYQTCHRRFQQWVRSGVLRRILEHLAQDLRDRGGIDLEECFVDGTFASAKKGGSCVGKTKRGKGTKIMAMADGTGLPIALCIESASPHEVTLIDKLFQHRFLKNLPKRLIGDKAYDSDRFRLQLAQKGVDFIAPHRSSRRSPAMQDGRALRRYKRRWKVERLFAWLPNYRRILVRYEYHAENYLGFVLLGCTLILLRNYL